MIADSHNLVLYAMAIVALSVTWSSVKIIEKNYQLEKRISGLQQDVDLLDQQTKNQKLKNLYFTSDSYLDLAARKYFGKASPGEQLLLVPSDVATKYVHPEPTDSQTSQARKRTPAIIKHWQEWINFFTHRQS